MSAEQANSGGATISKPLTIVSWVLQVVIVLILAQSLFFKFTGHPGSVHLFELLGVEPWGRYAVGVAELVAVILLLVPKAAVIGALASGGVILGAIFSHLTKLGVSIEETGTAAIDDAVSGPSLFVMAVVVLVASVGVLVIRRGQLPFLGK